MDKGQVINMDRLIFRAWDDLNKKWFGDSNDGFSLTGECILFGEWAHFFDEFLFCKNGKEPKHLMIDQFTGLKDRNGKCIYEGDVVLYCGEIHQIVFQDCSFMFAVIKPKDFVVESIFETHKTMTRNSFLCEIIGNIHENPDLL